jgi:hypothetical protein
MKKSGLPRYEHTVRDIRTGGTWFAYARTNDTTNVAIFATLVLKQLELYGVDMNKAVIQSDNGSDAYSLYFNFNRGNRYKGCKSPIEILEKIEHNSKDIISLQVFNFPPVIIDDFLEIFIDKGMNGGYHVGSSAASKKGSISNFVMEKRMAHLKIIRVKKIRR